VPARPLGKGRLGKDKAFGSGEGRMKSGARRDVELGLTALVHNFGFYCAYKKYLRIQSVPQRKHHILPLQNSTG
jgi:hypothetical protein